MQPEIPPDTSTLVALTGLAGFFVIIVVAWIIAFRRYGPRMVTTTTTTPGFTHAQADGDDKPVRVVEVPIACAVDGGPLLDGRFMLIADRNTGQRRTVRQIVTPPGPATPIFPVSIPSVPDETPPADHQADIEQQQTQVLPAAPKPQTKPRYPVILNGNGEQMVIAKAMPADMLPRSYWN